MDIQLLGGLLQASFAGEEYLQQGNILGNLILGAVLEDPPQVFQLVFPGQVVHQQLRAQRFKTGYGAIAVGGGVPGAVGLQIGSVDILGLAVHAEDHVHPQLILHAGADILAQLHECLGLLLMQQQNLPGGVSQDNAALSPDGHIHQVLHLLQEHLTLQRAGVLLPVPGGGHYAPPGNPDVDAHGKAPLGQSLGVVQPGTQDPVLQKPALNTLIQLPSLQDHPLPDENFRHFLDDLAVLDDLGIFAGDADDPLNLPVHLNGQVDAPADVGQLLL